MVDDACTFAVCAMTCERGPMGSASYFRGCGPTFMASILQLALNVHDLVG